MPIAKFTIFINTKTTFGINYTIYIFWLLEGSFEVPSGYGGCLQPSWACLPSSYQAKSQQYCGPNGQRLALFMAYE